MFQPKGALPPPDQDQIDIPPPEQPAPFSEGTPSVVMPQQSLVSSSEQNAVSQPTESEIILPPPTVQQVCALSLLLSTKSSRQIDSFSRLRTFFLNK